MIYPLISKRHAVLTAVQANFDDNIEGAFRFASNLNSPKSVFDALVKHVLLVHENKLSNIASVLALYIASNSQQVQQEIIDLLIKNGEAYALVRAKRTLGISLTEREISALLVSMIYFNKTNENDTGEILNILACRRVSEPKMVRKHRMVFYATLGKDSKIPTLDNIALSPDE